MNTADLLLRPIAPITLMNFDTLTKIFEFVDTGLDSSDIKLSQKRLLHLSLTCKAFLDPALDSLWRSMNSILPLLRLLPTLEVIDGIYMLCGKVQDQDLNRFKSYARRIRTYFLDSTAQPVLAPFTLTQMQALPLLPALRHLRCSSLQPLLTLTIPLLFSPTLEYFELMNVVPDPRVTGALLYALENYAPDLKQLILHRPSSAEFLSSVLTFRQLRSLSLSGNIDFRLFQQIAALPELRCLIVDLSVLTPTTAPDTAIIRFTKLQKLRITGFASVVASYCSYMRGGVLDDIVIEWKPEANLIREVSRQGHWERCLSVMVSHWVSTLRSLVLSTRTHIRLITSPQFFSILSKLHLERLHIEGWQLSLKQFEELAPAIPKIKELLIRVASTAHRMPLKLFYVFAQSCPDATLLQIRFRRLCTTEVPQLNGNSVSTHGLKTLIVDSKDPLDPAGLQDALGVAQYLDHLFPHLQTIQGTGIEPDGVAFWSNVYDIVQKFQRARREERQRAAF
ncbi:hypothetical protein FPV67DRAFT_158127 [Lyophyllum atratum]|nr:hypothetical protein FPV67DRAFT_158127 [Lyophyllum atratum]